MHYTYGRTNGKGRTTLQMYYQKFPNRWMLDHRIFSTIVFQLCETGWRTAILSSSFEESLDRVQLFVNQDVADRPESSTRAVAHNVKCESTDRLDSCKLKSLSPFQFSGNTSFESGKPILCTWTSASGFCRNVRCIRTSLLICYLQMRRRLHARVYLMCTISMWGNQHSTRPHV